MTGVCNAQLQIPQHYYQALQDFASEDAENPWGTKNEKAPEEVRQFGQIAGLWLIQNESMNRQGEWSAPDTAYWAFKYILDGYAVQDLYLVERDGVYGSLTQIRLFQPEEENWRIKYISTNSDGTTQHGDFIATEEDGAMVMNELELKEGSVRITFFDMQSDSFQWRTEYYIEQAGRWIDVAKISATRVALDDFTMSD